MCLISLQPWPHLAAQPTRPGEPSFCLIFQSGEHILSVITLEGFAPEPRGGGDTGRGPKKRTLDSEIKIRLQLTYLVVNLLHLICYLWNWEKEIINEVINKQSISAKPQSGRVGPGLQLSPGLATECVCLCLGMLLFVDGLICE